ncbi:MAG: hypothetical protein WDO74_26000 [Pseudomonadota bacterium]
MWLGGRACRTEQPGRESDEPFARHESARQGEHLISKAGDDHGSALVESPQPSVDDGPRFAELAVDRRVADFGAERVDETGAGGPGQRAVTATPAARDSAHSAWLNDSTNALLAPYTAW